MRAKTIIPARTLCVSYSAELAVWTVHTDARRRVIVTPDDIARGGRLYYARHLFEQARTAAQHGRYGVFVDLDACKAGGAK